MIPSAKAEILAASVGSGVTLSAVRATSIELPVTCTVSSPTAIELETGSDSVVEALAVEESEVGALGLSVTVLVVTEVVTASLAEDSPALGEELAGATNAYAHSLPLSPKPLQLEQRSMPGVVLAASSATSLALDFKRATLALLSTSTLGS